MSQTNKNDEFTVVGAEATALFEVPKQIKMPCAQLRTRLSNVEQELHSRRAHLAALSSYIADLQLIIKQHVKHELQVRQKLKDCRFLLVWEALSNEDLADICMTYLNICICPVETCATECPRGLGKCFVHLKYVRNLTCVGTIALQSNGFPEFDNLIDREVWDYLVANSHSKVQIINPQEDTQRCWSDFKEVSFRF